MLHLFGIVVFAIGGVAVLYVLCSAITLIIGGELLVEKKIPYSVFLIKDHYWLGILLGGFVPIVCYIIGMALI